MIIFAIKDKHHKRRPAEAWLFYDEQNEKFSIKIAESSDFSRLPLILGFLFEKGYTEIDDYWSRRFVKERIVPSERQNIGEILKKNGLTEYKEIDMLRLSKGSCCQDDFYLEETDSYNDVSNAIGYQVLQARMTSGFTQKELAKACGIKQSNLSRIENGVCIPSVETLTQIAKGLGKELRVSFE